MSVQYMSFSAHADAKGIMQLIQHCEPSKVLLVHGEASKMEFLKKKITQELGMLICLSVHVSINSDYVYIICYPLNCFLLETEISANTLPNFFLKIFCSVNYLLNYSVLNVKLYENFLHCKA